VRGKATPNEGKKKEPGRKSSKKEEGGGAILHHHVQTCGEHKGGPAMTLGKKKQLKGKRLPGGWGKRLV